MKNCKEKILFLLAVALGVLAVYLRIHTYTTGQDPRTFLLIAKVFAGETVPEVDPRLVVPGWPLLLSVVIRLFGIHAAFWTNVPLFILLAWTIRALAEEVTGRPGRSMLVAAGSALLLLGGYPVNPHFLLWVFRQTPMYLTGMLSFLCLARAVRRQAAGRLGAAAGWLGGAGLATAAGVLVRETGVLLLPAMGLYLLANALGWAGPSADRDKPARYRWFLVGLLAGAGVAAVAAGLAAVFLFRIRLASQQGGFLVQQLPWIIERPVSASPWTNMLQALPEEFGRFGVLCLLAGIGSSLRRRHREFLFLFLLPALAYWGFDGALQRFHRRFYLSTLTFLAPLAMHGACTVAEWAWRFAKARLAALRSLPRRTVWVAGWCAMGVWFLHVLVHVHPWGPKTSRTDVDRALAALAPWVGPDRPLLVDWRSRYLTDLLEVFTDWPAEVVKPAGAATYVRTPELVFARPLDGHALWDKSVVVGIRADSILENNVRLEEVPGTNVFFLGDAAFRLERVLPWVQRRAACSIPPPPEAHLQPPPPAVLLRVQAPAGAATNPVRVSLQGRGIAERLHPGYNFLAVPRSLADAVREAGGGELVFEADDPIPEDFSPEWLFPDAPLEMVFGSVYQPSYDNYLSDEFRALADMPLPDRNYPEWPVRTKMAEFGGDGRISLPEGLDGEGAVDASWLFALNVQPVCGDPDGTMSVTLSLPDFPDVPPQTAVAPHTEERHLLRFRFGPLPRAPRVLEMHVDHDMSVSKYLLSNPRVRNVQLIGLSMKSIPLIDALSISFGSPWDGRFLMGGLHAGENGNTPNHGRWTDGAAEIEMPLRPGRDYRLEIDFDEFRPRVLPPADPHFEWNGEILESTPTESGLAAVVPSAQVGSENTLRILSGTWCPSDFGMNDRRTLGIFIHNLTASPI